ncbi:MAG: hypothetical protein SGI73_00565 [Chloroflexota bacterium]|nr:hypothetical protein [Chloroflexota bacterium]
MSTQANMGSLGRDRPMLLKFSVLATVYAAAQPAASFERIA